MKIKKFALKYNRILCAFLMGLVPILCCIITCAFDKKSVLDVYIPKSTWNDELYYYKLVEAVLENGFPQGYYGFNESHALKLSFAAWSPVLLLPFIIWGLVFGWNLLSPVLCNMFMMALAVFLFTYLAKPKKWQMAAMTVMMGMFTPMVRYSFACMPEITCFLLIIFFLGLALSYCEKESNVKIFGMFFLSALATLMRPYFVLFLLLPGYYWVKKHKLAGTLGTLGIVGITGGIYVAIKHYLGAEYFTDLFFTDWIERFFTEGFFAGIKFIFYKLFHVGINFYQMLKESFISGLPAGALFAAFVLIVILMLATALGKWKRKEKDTSVYVHFSFCMLGMWAALLLMYKMTEGSKHLSAFIITGILLLSLVSAKQWYKWVLTAGLCFFLFVIMAKEPINYEIPYKTDDLVTELEDLKEQFDTHLEFTDKVPSFENTVIWVFSDQVEDEEIQLSWQQLYALPGNYGINLCYDWYILEHFETLQSRYIATVPGGKIHKLLQDTGAELIAENDEIVVYKRY